MKLPCYTTVKYVDMIIMHLSVWNNHFISFILLQIYYNLTLSSFKFNRCHTPRLKYSYSLLSSSPCLDNIFEFSIKKCFEIIKIDTFSVKYYVQYLHNFPWIKVATLSMIIFSANFLHKCKKREISLINTCYFQKSELFILPTKTQKLVARKAISLRTFLSNPR